MCVCIGTGPTSYAPVINGIISTCSVFGHQRCFAAFESACLQSVSSWFESRLWRPKCCLGRVRVKVVRHNRCVRETKTRPDEESKSEQRANAASQTHLYLVCNRWAQLWLDAKNINSDNYTNNVIRGGLVCNIYDGKNKASKHKEYINDRFFSLRGKKANSVLTGLLSEEEQRVLIPGLNAYIWQWYGNTNSGSDMRTPGKGHCWGETRRVHLKNRVSFGQSATPWPASAP